MNIHLNTSGDPRGDIPTIEADDHRLWHGDLSVPGRCSFNGVSDTINGGFTLKADFGRLNVRGVFPPYPRRSNYEGADLQPPLPPIVYSSAQQPVRAIGDRFWLGDSVWFWKGSTQFRILPYFVENNGLWSQLVDQAKAGGGNLIRTVCMKANNRGWEFRPSSLTADHLKRFADELRTKQMRAELTVFCDTAAMMPDAGARRAFMDNVIAPGVQAASDVFFVEWINEAGHGTQAVRPEEVYKIPGVNCSRGSGLTDTYPPTPFMDYTTYHGRRTERNNDGRPVSNYSHFAWVENLVEQVPFVNEETNKPPDFGYNTDVYLRMGLHARCATGGTFHWDGGVTGQPMDPPTFACYEAFCRGVDGK